MRVTAAAVIYISTAAGRLAQDVVVDGLNGGHTAADDDDKQLGCRPDIEFIRFPCFACEQKIITGARKVEKSGGVAEEEHTCNIRSSAQGRQVLGLNRRKDGGGKGKSQERT